jgi:hypothetical protein
MLDFTQFTFPQYVAEPAHALVANTLDRIVSGEIKQLMLFMPPQNGKSELVLDLVNGSGVVSTFYDYPKAVKVVGKFGYATTVPALIKQAATIQVCRWYMRAKEGFMDQGAWMYARELDPDVKVMLGTMRVSML